MKTFNSLLFDTSQKGRDFEVGTALLLHLLGFSIVHLGGVPKLHQDLPDIVAFAQSKILVVECTSGRATNKDKAGKVIHRRDQLRRALADSGFADVIVHAALISSSPRDTSIESIPEVQSGELVALTREDLEAAVNAYSIAPDPDRWFQQITEAPSLLNPNRRPFAAL